MANGQNDVTILGLPFGTWKRIGLIAVIAFAFILPALVSDYRIFQFTLALTWAIAILGLNLVTGFTGQISLGHGAFYAIGAYTAAILMDHWEVSYVLTLPAAAIVCMIVGFLFGYPAGRLQGHYLALATFALAVTVPPILKYDPLEEWTGGVQGIFLLKPEPPFGLPINEDQWLYYFVLMVAIVLFVFAYNMLRGRSGRAMMSIRDHEVAAKTMGVNTAFYKSTVFGISGMYTGIAGALTAIVVQFVAPDSFNFVVSINIFVGMVVGGLASISGAIFGGIFIQFIPNIAEQISKAAPWAIYGIVLISFMYLMPFGIAGFAKILIHRGLHRLRHGREPAAPEPETERA